VDPRHNDRERGMALVIALVTLTLLSILGIVLLTSLNSESRLASYDANATTAHSIAEAGIAEATSRIASGEISFGTNARGTAVVFNGLSGNLPPVGADTTALATAQPAGAWLAYSTSNKGPNMLTVSYRTDAARTVIYKYDATKNPPIQTVSGMPIYQITSTGICGKSQRRILAEVMQQPVVINIRAAVAAGRDIDKFTGNAFACGYNHRADTPSGTGEKGRSGSGGCNESANHWEVGSGNLSGLWSTGAIGSGGNGNRDGVPPESPGNATFYAGPWESLGMTQAAFYAWIGTRQPSMPGDLNGIYYIDDNGTTQDHSWSGTASGATGSGLLYVDGDLTMNSGFTYRGLIYVEGDVAFNGNAWILGALIVKGNTNIKINGGATVLYSEDAIVQNIAKSKGAFATLSWREF
jgi:Tfp pilus assembly protein PilX